jgi:hypothetical protein
MSSVLSVARCALCPPALSWVPRSLNAAAQCHQECTRAISATVVRLLPSRIHTSSLVRLRGRARARAAPLPSGPSPLQRSVALPSPQPPGLRRDNSLDLLFRNSSRLHILLCLRAAQGEHLCPGASAELAYLLLLTSGETSSYLPSRGALKVRPDGGALLIWRARLGEVRTAALRRVGTVRIAIGGGGRC